MNVSIRAWKQEDARQLAGLLNNAKVQDNLRDGIPFPFTEADAENFLAAMLQADRSSTFAWAIVADGAVAGSIAVFRKENVHRLTEEMGYFIGEEYWGKGVATAAVKLVCASIFETTDIVRIFAEPFAWNGASCAVLEKAGFAFEGILRKNVIKNGEIADMRLYAMVKE